MSKVVITGIGMVTPYGVGFEVFADGIRTRQPVFTPISICDTTDSKITFAGQCHALESAPLKNRKIKKLVNRKDLLALAAVHDAWTHSKLDNADIAPERAGVFVGACSTQIGDFFPYFDHVIACVSDDRLSFDSSRLGKSVLQEVNPIVALKVLSNGALAHVSQTYNLQGPNTNIMNFGTSGTEALQMAADAIASNSADICVVTSMYAPFDPFQLADGVIQAEWTCATSDFEKRVKPYADDANGTLPTESGVAIILESERHAQRRRGQIFAELIDWSLGTCGARADGTGLGVALSKLQFVPKQSLGCAHGNRQIDRWEREALGADSNLHSIYNFFGYPAEASGLVQTAVVIASGSFGEITTPFGQIKGAQPTLVNTLNRFGGAATAVIQPQI